MKSVSRRKRGRRRGLQFESLEARRLLTVAWRNPSDSLDVNNDHVIAPIDALLVVNEINRSGGGALAGSPKAEEDYLDTSGDSQVSPIDALLVINSLNARGAGPREVHESSLLADEDLVTITAGDTSGGGARTLRLEIDAAFDTTATSPLDDVFAVYIVDRDQPSTTLIDRGQPGTAVFTLSGSRADFAPGLARWDGSNLELDLSSLAWIDTALLKLQLLRGDDDLQSRVTVRRISNRIDPDASPAPPWIAPTSALAPGSAVNMAGLTLRGDAQVQIENVRFDSSSGRFQADARLRAGPNPLGRTATLLMPDLPSGVSLANASGTTVTGVPYLNLAAGIPRGGLERGMSSDLVQIELSVVGNQPFTLGPQVFAADNRPPALDVVGPRTIQPGGVLELALDATDPDGDRVAYSLRSDVPLPTGTLTGDGRFVFAPTPTEIGTYHFTVVASDGALEASQPVTLNVTADPLNTTRISGFVRDVDLSPLAGIQVEVGGIHGLTQADGSFLLDLGAGPVVSDTIKIRGETFSGGGAVAYPFIAEKLAFVLEHDVFAGVNNVISRPIFLPPLDVAGGTAVNPLTDTTVSQEVAPGEFAEVFVAAGTLMNQQGTPFTGVLSITEVPRELTPAALPKTLHPDLVVTIQPGEMVFATPAPLTFPNRGGWVPGSRMTLWSINPVTGEFDDVGEMQVTADGERIETISGGVRNSSWHFPSPSPPGMPPRKGPRWPSNGNGRGSGGRFGTCSAKGGFTSSCEKFSGALLETHDLVAYQSQGTLTHVTLTYDSLRADPRPILHVATGPADVVAPQFYLYASAELQRDGVTVAVPGYTGDNPTLPQGAHFWKINQPVGSRVPNEAAIQADLRDQPTGKYVARTMTGLAIIRDSSASLTEANEDEFNVLHVNGRGSPVGNGWSLAGISQIVANGDGSVLLVDSDGAALFDPPAGVGQPFGSSAGDYGVLRRLDHGGYRLTEKDLMALDFDADGRLIERRDGRGNSTRYEYVDGRLARIVDPMGLATRFTYDENGWLESITDPAQRTTALEHDGHGNLTRVIDPDGATRTWRYDADFHMIGETDALGREEQAFFDFAGRATRAIRKDGSEVRVRPLQVQGLFPSEQTMDPATAPTALAKLATEVTYVDGNGNTLIQQLDALGNAIGGRDAAGFLATELRDDQNRLTGVTDARGNFTSIFYDSFGNPVRVTDGLASGGSADRLFPRHVTQTDATPSVPLNWQAPAIADFSGDGIPDQAVTRGGSIDTFLGKGDGLFVPLQTLPNPGGVMNIFDESRSLFVGTILGNDDDPDLVVRQASQLRIFPGVGEGTFAVDNVLSVPLPHPPLLLQMLDVDNDGDADFVARWESYTLSTGAMESAGFDVIVQTGNGTFDVRTLEQPLPQQRFVMMRPFRLGNDPNLDLAALDADGSVRFFRNNGQGEFTLAATLPPRSAVLTGDVTFSGGWATTADFNDDGLDDVAVSLKAERPGFFPYSFFQVQLQQQDAAFDAVETSIGDSWQDRFQPIHANGDGIPDLLIQYANPGYGPSSQVTLGDGTGRFPFPRLSPVTLFSGKLATVADLNGDRRDDIALTDTRVLQSLLSNGDGTFDSATLAAPYIFDFPIAADFNGDSLLDVVSLTGDSIEVTLAKPGTKVEFGPGQLLNQFGSLARTLTVADVDGEHGPDLVGINPGFGGGLSVWPNDGLGRFGERRDFPIPVDFLSREMRLALGDVDGDGDLDAVVGEPQYSGSSSKTVLLQNNGQGQFQENQIIVTGISATSLVLGDLNGDAFPDLITGSHGLSSVSDPSTRVLLNDGQGGFLAPRELAELRNVTHMDLADLDGDQDLDLLVVNFEPGGSFPAFVRVFGNQGKNSATFVETSSFSVTSRHDSGGLDLGDVNGDGFPDLLLVTDGSQTVSVYLNDRTGAFEPVREFITNGGRFEVDMGVLIGDFTRDGIADVMVRGELFPGSGGAFIPEGTGHTDSTYDAVWNEPTSATDQLGHMTRYEIDPLTGLRTSETHVIGDVGGPDDIVTRYTYTAQGQIDTVTDALGRVTDYGYDSFGRVTQVTFAVGTPDEATRRVEYDAAGNKTADIDEIGNRTSYAYDARNRLIRLTRADPDGDGPLTSPQTKYSYDLAGNMIRKTDAHNSDTRYLYDDQNQLRKLIDALGGETTFTYDPAGNLTSRKDPLGRETRFRYDGRNRLTEVIDALGGVTRRRYDAEDNLIALTNQNNQTTQFSYDARNRLVFTTDALGQTTLYGYDAADNLVFERNRNGQTTAMSYDESNRQVRTTNPLHGVKRYVYDAMNNVVAITDELNRTTSFGYDARDRLATRVNPLNGVMTYEYDKAGSLESVTDELGRVTRYAYDHLNRQIRRTDALNGVVSLSYNSMDQLVAVTDELGHRTENVYDLLGRSTMVTDPSGHKSTLQYDAVGNVLASTDPLNGVVRHVYDKSNRVSESIDAANTSIRYLYDPVGNLVSLTDAAGNATTFAYDELNRLTSETNSLGARREYSHDPEGNVISTTDRNGRTRTMAYDALNRQVREQWLDTEGNTLRTFSWEFDPAGQLLTAFDPDSHYAYMYDDLGRIISSSNAGTPGVPAVAWHATYDAVDNLLTRSESVANGTAAINTYSYDPLDRVTRILQTGDGVADKRVEFAYDAASQITNLARFADLAGTRLVASSAFDYDDDGRLTGLTHTHNLTTIADYTWTLDPAHRIIRMTTQDGTSDYAYDVAGQLIAADHSFQPDESYQYDPLGNRADAGDHTGPSNQLLSDGEFSYHYDPEGNLIRRTTLATNVVTEYKWDHRSRLIRATTMSSTGSVTHEVEYTYDVFDRRIAKSMDPDLAGPLAPEIERFVYDGAHIGLVFDGQGTLTHRYLHGPAVDQILADENSLLEIIWPLTDHQGTVRDLVNTNGNLVGHFQYDSFGNLTRQTGQATSFRFGYTGRELDVETGLLYFRARYYDPATGRFLSEDPIGFAAADPNLYRMVRNSMLNAMDPFGLRADDFEYRENRLKGGLPDETISKLNELKVEAVDFAMNFVPFRAGVSEIREGNKVIGGALIVVDAVLFPVVPARVAAACVKLGMRAGTRVLPNLGLTGRTLVQSRRVPQVVYSRTQDFDTIASSGRFWGQTEGAAYGLTNQKWWRSMTTTPTRNAGVIRFEGQAATLFSPHPVDGPYSLMKRALGQHKAGFGDVVFDQSEVLTKLVANEARIYEIKELVVREAHIGTHAGQSADRAARRLLGRQAVIEPLAYVTVVGSHNANATNVRAP